MLSMGLDFHTWDDCLVRFLTDADGILGFPYSCLILFGALAVIPITAFVILRVVRNSHAV